MSLLREPIALIRKRSADEAKQLERAGNSVVRNLAEGNGRFGRDRLQHFAIAYGSLCEAKASLDLALRLGWLAVQPAAYATGHHALAPRGPTAPAAPAPVTA